MHIFGLGRTCSMADMVNTQQMPHHKTIIVFLFFYQFFRNSLKNCSIACMEVSHIISITTHTMIAESKQFYPCIISKNNRFLLG